MTKFEITWLEDRSDEAVLAEIRRVAKLIPNQRLTKIAFNAHSKISASAVEVRFGSWGDATRKAGLIDALPDYSSDTAIIEDMRRVAESFPNDSFTQTLYSTNGKYSCSFLKRRFGSWQKALDTAQIGDRFVGPFITERMKAQPGRAMSDEQILTAIRAVFAQLDKTPLSVGDIEANSEITQSLMYRRFGSASEAFRQAGVEQSSHGRRHTENEVFENLLIVWTHYGRPPTVSEMDIPPSTVGKSTYIHRYGGWRKALKAFIERATSESDGDPAVDTEQDISKHAERTDVIGSQITGTVLTKKLQSVSQIIAQSGGTKPLPVKPEDRREPSISLRFKVLQRDQFRCRLCGRSPATELSCKLHVDHVLAFSKGGKTILENLQTLCSTCNVGKSNRSIEQQT